MKFLSLILVASSMALSVHADTVSSESWTIGNKVFTSKAEVIRYVVSSGTQDEIVHTQCQILTNKLTLKACPKNKMASWDNERFKSINETKTK